MSKELSAKIVLCIAGLSSIAIGVILMTQPLVFYKSALNLAAEIDLLSDLRATGGFLFTVGFLISAGAFIKSIRYTAALVSVLAYFSYAIVRLISITIDGTPGESMIAAMIAEFALGTLSIYPLLHFKKTET